MQQKFGKSVVGTHALPLITREHANRCKSELNWRQTSIDLLAYGGSTEQVPRAFDVRTTVSDRRMGRDFENRKASIFKTAAIKSKLYSRYGKLLYVTAKNGVPDPANNPALRNLIERAKKEQIPSHVIEKAIEKAKGAGGEDFQPVRYEGFGPGGCSVIVDCLTDNNNRTVTDIRTAFTRSGSKLGPSGSVAHMFDHIAVFIFKWDDGDQILEAMLNADVDVTDVESGDGKVTLIVPPAEFYKAKTALMEAFPKIELETQEVTFHPQATKEISAEDVPMFEKFMNLLNEMEDIQEIYHNAVLPS